jgi:hypothetical protein
MSDAEHLPPSRRRGRWLRRSSRSSAADSHGHVPLPSLTLSAKALKTRASAVAPKTAALKLTGLVVVLAGALSLSSASAVAQSLGRPEYVDPCAHLACLDPAPAVSAPVLTGVGDPLNPLPGAGGGSSGQIAVQLNWTATDPNEIREFHLERNAWGLGWTPLQGFSSVKDPTDPSTQRGSINTLLQAPGIPYQFRVRAVDAAGNTSAWVYSGMIGAYDDSSPKFGYAGDPDVGDPATPGWKTVFDQFSLGGSVKVNSGGHAGLSCKCRYIGWVGRVHPNGGTAQVWVDGLWAKAVSQHHPTISYVRRVLFTAAFQQAGQHRVQILSTPGPPSLQTTDIDAFVVDHG